MTAMIYLFIILVGLTLGSFGNVILYRLPAGEPIRGRSRCRKCENIIRWFDLIPIISFAFLLGKCRRCKSHISIRYPVFEGITAAVFLLVFMTHETYSYLQIAMLIAACYILLLTAFYDASTKKIPDIFSVILIFTAISFQLLHGDSKELWQSVFGGGAVPLAFFGGLWIASRGKWIGNGDIMLGTGIGLLLGLKLVLISLFFAYAFGAAVALFMIATGRARRGSIIAFGPFLCSGAIIAILAGNIFI